MKHQLSFLAAALALVGCTQTKFTGPNGVSVERTSFLQSSKIGGVRIDGKGAVSIQNYENDGGNEALRIAIEAAIAAAAKSAVPAP